MKCLFLAWVVVMGLARSAGAQPPGETEPTIAAFLERRVPDELATEGVVLSRRNLGLHVEQLADKWLVSLVDLTTGRVAASTKVDVLPADREAAVAVMTHVVADLVAQIVGRTELPPAPAPVAAPPVSPTVEQILREQHAEREQRDEREQRAAVDLAYKRRLIRLSETYDLTASPSEDGSRLRWAAYRGKPTEQLDPLTFYREVGRPDLADEYVTRKQLMIGGFVVAGLAFVGSYVLLFYELTKDFSNQADCIEMNSNCNTDGASYVPPVLAFGVGAIAVGTGIYYATHRQPISENDARALADAYNQRLHGMPAAPPASRSSLLHDVHMIPYAARHTTGLVLGARF
jgi:hypothetical protein